MPANPPSRLPARHYCWNVAFVLRSKCPLLMPIPAHPLLSLTLLTLPARLLCLLTVSITTYMSSLQQADLAFIASLSLRVEPFGLAIDCPTCGGTVPITICVSDKHGNAGKPMAKVCVALSSDTCVVDYCTNLPCQHPLCSYYHFSPFFCHAQASWH
jgi:hypothetical protein